MCLSFSGSCYCLQTKLREGNVFTPVCQSVHRGACMQGACVVGACMAGDMHGRCMAGGAWGHAWWGNAWQGGMHPTGMHSCLMSDFVWNQSSLYSPPEHELIPVVALERIVNLLCNPEMSDCISLINTDYWRSSLCLDHIWVWCFQWTVLNSISWRRHSLDSLRALLPLWTFPVIASTVRE